ncbi:MAG: response regulator [Ferruginibacter sp.]
MKTILLIEDNEDIRNNTAEILELANYNVLTAENGKEGIEKAIEYNPGLIICDIMMPELDGYAVLHAIQKHEKLRHTPFIFLTAKTERSDFRKGMELGADDYISKPFDGTELLNAVDARFKKAEQVKKEILSAGGKPAEKIAAKEILHALIQNRSINKYKKKQVVYSEGNHPNRLYYVLLGKVKAYKTNDEGKELVTDLYSPGDFLGHIAMMEGTVYKDTAEALEYSELALIPREEFDELLNNNAEVAKSFIQILAKNISEKEDHLLSLTYNSLRRKVADALLLVQNKFSTQSEDIFTIDISRDSLANIAGTATESLIRTLGDFKNEKLIDIENSRIRILDAKKLAAMIN